MTDKPSEEEKVRLLEGMKQMLEADFSGSKPYVLVHVNGETYELDSPEGRRAILDRGKA